MTLAMQFTEYGQNKERLISMRMSTGNKWVTACVAGMICIGSSIGGSMSHSRETLTRANKIVVQYTNVTNVTTWDFQSKKGAKLETSRGEVPVFCFFDIDIEDFQEVASFLSEGSSEEFYIEENIVAELSLGRLKLLSINAHHQMQALGFGAIRLGDQDAVSLLDTVQTYAETSQGC